MDKHKPISVKMNGKSTSISRDSKKEEPLSTTYQEQAATVEQRFDPKDLMEYQINDSRDSKDDFFMNSSRKSKLPPGFKLFIFAALSAIIVGTILGFTMLRMFAGIDENQAEQSTTTTPTGDQLGTDQENGAVADDDSTNDSETTSFSIDSMQAVVIQGGVFSSQDKAEQWQLQYTEEGIPSMIWGVDDEYRLFAGIGNTEEYAELTAESMMATDLEAYVRPWQTEALEINVTEREHLWLEGFADQWQQSITALESDKTLSNVISSWETWLSDYPEDTSEGVQALQQMGQQLVDHVNSEEAEQQIQIDLLRLWKKYIAIGES